MRRWRFPLGDGAGRTLPGILIAALIAGAPSHALDLRSRVQFGPLAGESLTFRLHDQPGPTWRADAMRSSANRSCIVSSAIVTVSDRRIVVERRLPDGRTFLAHRAGRPTSNHPGNCGRDVDRAIGLAAIETPANTDAKATQQHFIGS